MKILVFLLMIFTSQLAMAESMTCTQRQSSFNCLVCNCYYETRGEPMEGKVAVAKTVLSRIDSPEFPDSACAVIYQPSQFSWTPDSSAVTLNAREPGDRQALKDCREAANKALDDGPNGLIYFYNPRKASPAWARRMRNCGRAGSHVFMVPREDTCPRNLGANPATRTQQPKKSSNGGAAR